MLLSFVIFRFLKCWLSTQDRKQGIFLLLTECAKVSKESPTKYCVDYRTERICVLIASFPFPLYMEMKRSFMLFPLVALFIAVWRFISWFHLRFRRLFLGKPLKCVSDSKQSSSRFLSRFLSLFKVNWATTWSQNPSNTVLRKGSVLVSWLTWKENRGSSLSLALLASLVQYGWTSNDLLGVICVTIEATWVLFNVLCCIANEVSGFLKSADMFQI